MTPLQTHISAVVINMVLDLIMPLLLAAARTPEAARQAAREMLADYQPQTAEELGLAAEIIALRLKALSALRDASLPGTPNGPMLALLKAANSLRRNQSSGQRKLDAPRPPRPAETCRRPAAGQAGPGRARTGALSVPAASGAPRAA